MIIDSHAHDTHACYRNSSLILPRVIDEIAALKGIDRDTVECVTAENAQKLFRLP